MARTGVGDLIFPADRPTGTLLPVSRGTSLQQRPFGEKDPSLPSATRREGPPVRSQKAIPSGNGTAQFRFGGVGGPTGVCTEGAPQAPRVLGPRTTKPGVRRQSTETAPGLNKSCVHTRLTVYVPPGAVPCVQSLLSTATQGPDTSPLWVE